MHTDQIPNPRHGAQRGSGARSLGENGEQDFQIDRLEHVMIETRRAGPLSIVVLTEAGDRDQGRPPQCGVLPNDLSELVAVHAG